ncbi:TrkH family potassium uptake protein [Desulfocurvibacter africanus]|uniref:H(+)-transporting two-sector ATPase n=1 Tax=Desulfocurvibacter africanus subsp. africanus str. Walvis Bay TaxID=690850 RepID=F3Z0V2_DESAF|nr:potassium transporter TrkG [Desulfocurvibacter africanus]EGJ51030.1 H(+)-transporting two-sector ATPase [Desulfocurvibacter africanus subsp. africanus str. Walvis Bay]
MFFKNLFSPFTLPIYFFGLAIAIGAILLNQPFSLAAGNISWIDALFTATSATCVTGLAVVDTGTAFSRVGQSIILALIQVGGLGIMTFASLFFYLWRRRVSLADRIAVGQNLLHNPAFHLGRFLTHMVLWTLMIEVSGALLLHFFDPEGFTLYSALFHSISAFCNAGFALHADSLVRFQDNVGVNMVIMSLIILGGLGFSVLVELEGFVHQRLARGGKRRLSWYTRIVLQTSLWLIVIGWIFIYITEFLGERSLLDPLSKILSSLFQSVTCRTAGFNTLDIGQMTNASLLFMMMLMIIGGSPGSTAGGIKTTTFRTLLAFAISQIKDRRQTVIGKHAVDLVTVNKALTLVIFAVTIIGTSMLILTITEGGDTSHAQASGNIFMDILFETISAFATVGLSTGITPKLSTQGKIVISLLMFIGRIGPIVFLSALQSLREEPYYAWPERNMLIG